MIYIDVFTNEPKLKETTFECTTMKRAMKVLANLGLEPVKETIDRAERISPSIIMMSIEVNAEQWRMFEGRVFT